MGKRKCKVKLEASSMSPLLSDQSRDRSPRPSIPSLDLQGFKCWNGNSIKHNESNESMEEKPCDKSIDWRKARVAPENGRGGVHGWSFQYIQGNSCLVGSFASNKPRENAWWKVNLTSNWSGDIRLAYSDHFPACLSADFDFICGNYSLIFLGLRARWRLIVYIKSVTFNTTWQDMYLFVFIICNELSLGSLIQIFIVDLFDEF